MASRTTATVSADGTADWRLPGAPAGDWSENVYSSLTSSIIADTGVLSCCRSTMSAVTRRIVSCVRRRSARSAAPEAAAASPPGAAARIGAQCITSRHARARKR